jgi:hypothetical protein
VDETVGAAIFRRDEAITFGFVEEFYGADGHGMFPFTKQKRSLGNRPKEPWQREMEKSETLFGA